MSETVKDYPPYLDYPKPRNTQTNADRIRAMTDEELAKHIVCEHKICEKEKFDCNSCMLDWLKQEVEE